MLLTSWLFACIFLGLLRSAMSSSQVLPLAVTSVHACLQMDDLKRRCVSQLVLNLSPETFVKTAVLAEHLQHQDLIDACVAFALRGENR